MLLSGLGLGFVIAAQVGPIWLLCVRTVLRGSTLAGLGIGLGAAVIDMAYSALGVMGVAALTQETAVRLAMSIAGMAVLVWMGVGAIREGFKQADADTDAPESSPGGASGLLSPKTFRSGLATSLAATATNPLTIASWAAVFAATSVVSTHGAVGAAWMVAGIGAGTILWFLTLTSFAHFTRRAFTAKALKYVDVVSGCLLIAFGVALFVRANF